MIYKRQGKEIRDFEQMQEMNIKEVKKKRKPPLTGTAFTLQKGQLNLIISYHL